MARSNSNITSLDDDAPEVAAANAGQAAVVSGSNHDGELSGERRTVTIHPTEGDGGSDAVNVGLNGFMYQVPRGLPQSIPVEVLEILKNAKTTSYSTGPGGVAVERTVQRHAFSVE